MKKQKVLFASIAALVCALLVIPQTVISARAENARYADADFISTYAIENVYYTSKSYGAQYQTTNGTPAYTPESSLPNSCGATAGAVALGFYDKYYPNLIPNYDSYYVNGRYKNKDTVVIPNLMNQLYTLMQTNVHDWGVSRAEFKTGFTSYVNSKGHTVSYPSVKSGSSINHNSIINAINSNKVLFLFSWAGDIYQVTQMNGYDAISNITITENHIMVVYGYKIYNYYSGSTLIRSDTYLEVVTGKAGNTKALFKASSTNLIDELCIVEIS